MHLPYACRQSGVCCGAGWPLPVEADRVAAIDRAVDAGRVTTVDGHRVWLLNHAGAPPGMAGHLRLTPAGHCVFHHRAGSAGGACAVHTALGHGALPSSCQHFPRVCLTDARGVHVTLSHYCPTAAGLLFDAQGPVTIVSGPPAVPGRDVPEGLDARAALPPLLTSRVLMDLDAYAEWERHMVETLAGVKPRGRSVDDAIALLAGEATTLAAWRPGGPTLADAVRGLGHAPHGSRGDVPSRLELCNAARAACPDEWAWPGPPDDLESVDARLVSPAWPEFDAELRRYAAAHAFGAWAAYQGETLTAVVTAVARALAVARIEAARVAGGAGRVLDRAAMVEAIRRADLLLRHYADPGRLSQNLVMW